MYIWEEANHFTKVRAIQVRVATAGVSNFNREPRKKGTSQNALSGHVKS